MERLQTFKEKGLEAPACIAEIHLVSVSGVCAITDFEITQDVLTLRLGEDSYIDILAYQLEKCCFEHDLLTGEESFTFCEVSEFGGTYITLTFNVVE